MASISSTNEFSRLYQLSYPSKEQYTNKSFPKDSKKSLHYLIALGQSASYIQKVATVYREKHPIYLDFADTQNYNLTPLALAVIYGRADVTEVLLHQGVKSDTQDCWGFTFLHHAALLGNTSQALTRLVNLVKAISMDLFEHLKGIQSKFGGTYEDIHRLVSPVLEDPQDCVCLINDAQNRARELKRAEFFQLTRRYFVSWFRSSAQTLIEMYRQPLNPDREFYLDPKHPSVSRFEQHPPSLSLKRYPGMGYGVEAMQKIEQEAITCFYIGELFPPVVDPLMPCTYSQTIYLMNGSDAATYCNLASCINDGPPNCYFKSVRDYKGISGAKIIVASRPIHSGEQLLIDYGSQHVTKSGPYQITKEAFEFLANFLSNFGGRLSLLLIEISKIKQLPEYTYHALPRSLFRYIFYTPTVFVQLYLLKVLDIGDTLTVLNSEFLIEEIANSGFSIESASMLAKSYEKPLRSLLKIYSHSNHSKLISLIEAFSSKMRADHLLEILALIHESDTLTIEEVEKCAILGQLLDNIYLFVNHTLVGTYINRTLGEDEKLPQVNLDSEKILVEYNKLNTAQKAGLINIVNKWLQMESLFMQRASKIESLKNLLGQLIKNK
jgi:hypothetical protein